jgi:hypothetical protein
MPIFYNVSELKALREVYRTFGITNSGVLDQIKTAITASHFDADANEELTDLTQQYLEMSGPVDFHLHCAIDKTKKMTTIHELAKSKGAAA